jgi:CBS domain-containing protein
LHYRPFSYILYLIPKLDEPLKTDTKDEQEEQKMKVVGDILSVKGDEKWAVQPETTVYDALSLMADKDIGALLVMEDEKLVGIFSERDYARKVILEGKSSKITPVKEIMSTKVYFVSPDQSIQEVMALMTNKHIRHIPVMQDEVLVGVISIGDVVKTIINEQEFTIDQLERYISGGGYGYL